jgi:hypothetical protein
VLRLISWLSHPGGTYCRAGNISSTPVSSTVVLSTKCSHSLLNTPKRARLYLRAGMFGLVKPFAKLQMCRNDVSRDCSTGHNLRRCSNNYRPYSRVRPGCRYPTNQTQHTQQSVARTNAGAQLQNKEYVWNNYQPYRNEFVFRYPSSAKY